MRVLSGESVTRNKNTVVLADKLSLPIDVVTQTIGVVAKRRAGKSYFMRRFVEQLVRAEQQVCVVDPKGDQWGILSSADGKGPGLPLVIIGGERGHVPLEPSGGEIVAKLVVEERVSALLDLSLLRKHEVATFMALFMETLYRLKAQERYRTPLMLAIDEADAIAPQKPEANEARMLGACEDIVRRGGQRGLGCMLVTQRTAVLNKNVLTQCQILVALRTISPQDRNAMNAWIDVHGEPEQRKTLMESLPSLPVGDAWVWSPGWPTNDGIFQRIHTLPIETFDSGATPKPGERRLVPKTVADVDLEAVRKQMAETIERAKADDPRVLRKRIAELEQLQRAKPAPAPSVPAISEQQRADISAAVTELDASLTKARDALKQLAKLLLVIGKTPKHVAGYQLMVPTMVAAPVKRTASCAASGGKLAGGERKILTALAQNPSGCTKKRLALLAGYALGGGGFNNYLSALRVRGLLDGGKHGDTAYRITDAGLCELGSFEPLPSGTELRTYWLNQLGKAERSILEALFSVYPRALDKQSIAEAAGYEAGGGGFNNALSRLRTLELIDGRGEMRASEDLFE
jgi:hypothetical protein